MQVLVHSSCRASFCQLRPLDMRPCNGRAVVSPSAQGQHVSGCISFLICVGSIMSMHHSWRALPPSRVGMGVQDAASRQQQQGVEMHNKL